MLAPLESFEGGVIKLTSDTSLQLNDCFSFRFVSVAIVQPLQLFASHTGATFDFSQDCDFDWTLPTVKRPKWSVMKLQHGYHYIKQAIYAHIFMYESVRVQNAASVGNQLTHRVRKNLLERRLTSVTHCFSLPILLRNSL